MTMTDVERWKCVCNTPDWPRGSLFDRAQCTYCECVQPTTPPARSAEESWAKSPFVGVETDYDKP